MFWLLKKRLTETVLLSTHNTCKDTLFFLKVSQNAYAYIFSHILRNGIYPSMWHENMIKPIYKGGGTMDTNNYRGIAISSCFYPYSTQATNRPNRNELIFFLFGGIRVVSLLFFLQS